MCSTADGSDNGSVRSSPQWYSGWLNSLKAKGFASPPAAPSAAPGRPVRWTVRRVCSLAPRTASTTRGRHDRSPVKMLARPVRSPTAVPTCTWSVLGGGASPSLARTCEWGGKTRLGWTLTSVGDSNS